MNHHSDNFRDELQKYDAACFSTTSSVIIPVPDKLVLSDWLKSLVL